MLPAPSPLTVPPGWSRRWAPQDSGKGTPPLPRPGLPTTPGQIPGLLCHGAQNSDVTPRELSSKTCYEKSSVSTEGGGSVGVVEVIRAVGGIAGVRRVGGGRVSRGRRAVRRVLGRAPSTPDRYRSLPKGGAYRFFMPVLQEGDEPRPARWWVGTTSHLLSHSLALVLASRQLQDPSLRDVAIRQIEWAVGANPFQASLITGHGVNQPWPHSRFVGLISGGIMNGIGVMSKTILSSIKKMVWRGRRTSTGARTTPGT